MSILETLQTIKSEGFDPKKDNVQKSTRLESGKYPVRLKKVQAGINEKSGQDQLAITLEVISGPKAKMTETIFMSFDESLPPFVLEKNGRTLLKIAAMVNLEFMQSDLADVFTLSDALTKGIGQQFQMDLRIAENKKNPNYPYRNYDFAPLEDASQPSIEEDDLPF